MSSEHSEFSRCEERRVKLLMLVCLIEVLLPPVIRHLKMAKNTKKH